MLRQIISISGIIIVMIFIACIPNSNSKRIKDVYILSHIDGYKNQSIIKEYNNSGSGEEVIPEYVFAVGNNDDYIIVKQHPVSRVNAVPEINASITNYYVIDLNNVQAFKDENIYGPLTEDEFIALQISLGIIHVKFHLNFREK